MKTVFYDTETGGLTPRHPTIQIAAIVVENGKEIATFDEKLRFVVADCESEALKLNSYDEKVWMKEAILPGQAMKKFCEWLGQYKDVEKLSKKGKRYNVARGAGHNVSGFDYPRLRALASEHDIFFPIDFHCLDTLQASVWHFHGKSEKPEDLKLTTLAKHFGLKTDFAHDALFDCRLSWEVAKKVVKTFQ